MKILIIVCCLFVSFSVSARPGANEKIALGKKVYMENCTTCHGTAGDGRGPAAVAIPGNKPRNFIEGKYKYGSSEKEIFKTITTGVPNSAMPPWGALSENDRWSVVAYIKSLKK